MRSASFSSLRSNLLFQMRVVSDFADLGNQVLRKPALGNLIGYETELLALLDGADGVLRGHVRDFVAQDAGELRFVLHQAEGPSRDVDEPPGAANAFTPSVSSTMNSQFEPRARARLRQRGAQERHVLGHLLVLVDAELGRAAIRLTVHRSPVLPCSVILMSSVLLRRVGGLVELAEAAELRVRRASPATTSATTSGL